MNEKTFHPSIFASANQARLFIPFLIASESSIIPRLTVDIKLDIDIKLDTGNKGCEMTLSYKLNSFCLSWFFGNVRYTILRSQPR